MNITLSVDEQTVEKARRVAQAMHKSLNQVIREYLEQLAGQDQAERDAEDSGGCPVRAGRTPTGSSAATRFMIASSSVDTAVLVYADDPRDPSKQARATELVAAALRTRLGVVSTQVLQEYFTTATAKLRLDAGLARAKVELIASMNLVQVDPPLTLAAIDLHRLHRLSFWDALILQAAAAAGCRELLSEDMQTGFRYGGVSVVNPFG